MQFTREITRLLAAFIVSLFIVAGAAAYWAVVGPDTILSRDDNPRRVVAEARIRRGAIYDRNGEVLVETVVENDGAVRRNYLYPATASALGYYSLRYGVGGAEAAYDSILRGDTVTRDFGETLVNSLLHRPQEGSDIRVSLDLELQTVIAEAMKGQTGAVVMLDVPSGQILALASVPTFDPNTLDADWETLRSAESQPFFNRALQGSYQPGGTLQTPLMAAALLYNRPLNVPLQPATRPVQIDDLELGCAVRLPEIALSLRESYAFACPFPFAVLGEALGPATLAATLETFGLTRQPTLPGFTAPATAPTPTPEALVIGRDDVIAAAVGQHDLTVSPLQMAMLAAGIVNDGNAPLPYMLLETRAPGASVWEPVQAIRPTSPIATMNTARQLQDLMRYAVANGAAQNAGRPNIDIGGHASLAYAGEGPLSWFIGFTTISARRGVAIAVVLENSADPGRAADIGGTALAVAHGQLQAASANSGA